MNVNVLDNKMLKLCELNIKNRDFIPNDANNYKINNKIQITHICIMIIAQKTLLLHVILENQINHI